MKRTRLNFLVDIVSFLNLLCLGFTGYIMKFILPPGSGGLGRQLHSGRGREPIREFLSLTRHEWGDIHFYLAVVFLALMLLHIILHWTWIKNRFKSLRPHSKTPRD